LSITLCCFFIIWCAKAQAQNTEDSVINTVALAQKAPNKADVELIGKIIEKAKDRYVLRDQTGEVNLEIADTRKITDLPPGKIVKVIGRVKTNYLRYINNSYFTTTIKVRKIVEVPDKPTETPKLEARPKPKT